MSALLIVLICIAGAATYCAVTIALWVFFIRTFNPPVKDHDKIDRFDYGVIAGLWLFTLLPVCTMAVAKRVDRALSKRAERKAADVPLFCDECKKKLKKGPHR